MVEICDQVFNSISQKVDLRSRSLAVPPFFIAISGPVGSGKSTLALRLNQKFLEADINSVVVSTDHFLLPNSEIATKKTLKGFPDSYDVDWMHRLYRQICQRKIAFYPFYSHLDYDRSLELQQLLTDRQVIISEGLNSFLIKPTDIAFYLMASGKECINSIDSRTIQMFKSNPDAKHPLNQQPLDEIKILKAVIKNWKNINRKSSWRHKPSLQQTVQYVYKRQLFESYDRSQLATIIYNLYWRWQLFDMIFVR